MATRKLHQSLRRCRSIQMGPVVIRGCSTSSYKSLLKETPCQWGFSSRSWRMTWRIIRGISLLLWYNSPSWPKVYLYFTEYFFLVNQINAKQVFSLILYLTFQFNKHKKNIVEHSAELLSVVYQEGINNTGLKLFIGSFSKVCGIFNYVLQCHNGFELGDKCDYQLFKVKLWIAVAIDQDTLSEVEFKDRYGLFEWFEDFRF